MSASSSDTQEKLIAAAQQELIEGRGQLEMQGVARRAGVSVGLAYHHFGSKAGLIAAVVEAFYSRLDAVVFSKDAVLPSQSWVAREKGRVEAYIRFHYGHPLALLVIGALSRSPEVINVEQAFTKRQLVAGAKMLEEAQRANAIALDIDPDLAIALMIGGIRQALISALAREPRPPAEKLTDQIWAFMAGGLGLSGGPGHR